MADQSVFNIRDTLTPDESIIAYNYHEFLPFNGQDQLNLVGNIQIDVMPTTTPYHLHNAYIKLEGVIVKKAASAAILETDDVQHRNDSATRIHHKGSLPSWFIFHTRAASIALFVR